MALKDLQDKKKARTKGLFYWLILSRGFADLTLWLRTRNELNSLVALRVELVRDNPRLPAIVCCGLAQVA